MGIKKQYVKNKPKCNVTFRYGAPQPIKAETVKILGDFNRWSKDCEPMKKLENGEFTQTIEFDSEKEYQFRYLLDDKLWDDEFEVDNYVSNGLGCNEFNSVISV